MQKQALELMELFQLNPHPEGGYFKETYCSAEMINREFLPLRFHGARYFSTAIYYLLEGDQFSAFHRLQSDELWHFYAGGPLNIYVIDYTGNLELIALGSNVLKGEVFQCVVKAGHWFAAQPAQPDSFAFVGCTVAPGFDFADFELADGEKLAEEFPKHAALISRLCRR